MSDLFIGTAPGFAMKRMEHVTVWMCKNMSVHVLGLYKGKSHRAGEQYLSFTV